MEKEKKENKKTENKTPSYYKAVQLPFGVLSCDGVRLTAELHKDSLHLMNVFTSSPRPDVVVYPPSNKRGSYRVMCTITYDVDITATLGIGLNATGTREDETKCMFDFNLNKVAPYEQFWRDLGTFKAASGLHEIKRLDVALDVPIPRENVLPCKDHRKYALELYDISNKTEYLGRRSNPGYVKVYNKQLEAGLDYPLTRIEITTEFDALKYQSYFPELYVASEKQLSIDQSAKVKRCQDPTRLNVIFGSQLIALHENPLPYLNAIDTKQKKKLLELLPLEPFPAVPFASVVQLLDNVGKSLGISL